MPNDETLHESIGERIKHYREISCLSQDQVAEALHVTRQAVSNWERGKTMPDLKTLEALCSVLNVSINTLTGLCESTEALEPKKSITGRPYYLLVVLAFAINCYFKAFFPAIVFFAIGSLIHFMFSSAIKNNDYSMLSGYDGQTEYRVRTLQQLVSHMEKHILFSSVGFLALAAYLSQVKSPSAVDGLLVVFYTMDMVGSMLYLNHKYSDDLFVHERDRQMSRLGNKVTLVFIVQLFAIIFVTLGLMEFHGIKNNTVEAMRLVMFFIPYFGFTMSAFFYETSRIKKEISNHETYKSSPFFIMASVVALITLGLMIWVATLG